MFVRTSLYLRGKAQRTGYTYYTLENNPRLSCSRTPLVISVHRHEKWGLLPFLSIIITVCCSCESLLLYSQESTANGVLFSYYMSLSFTFDPPHPHPPLFNFLDGRPMISHPHDSIFAFGKTFQLHLCLSVWKNELCFYLSPRLG